MARPAGTGADRPVTDAYFPNVTEDGAAWPGADLTNEPTKPGSEAMPERISTMVERHTRNPSNLEIRWREKNPVMLNLGMVWESVVEYRKRRVLFYHGSKVAWYSESSLAKQGFDSHFRNTGFV